MITGNFSSKLSFGRALTTKETELLANTLEKAREKAGIDFIAMNFPIAAAPAEPSQNTGIGTFLGASAVMKTIAPLTGINAKLQLPVGMTSKDYNYSPFNAPGFGLNIGYVNPFKLKESGLLDPEKDSDVLQDTLFKAQNNDGQYRTQYDRTEKVEAALNRAYENYEASPEKFKAVQEGFEMFKKDQSCWLDAYAKEKDSEKPERFKFKQFIAHRQYGEMRDSDKKAGLKGVKTIVDIPIGNDTLLDNAAAGKNIFTEDELASLKDDGTTNSWGSSVLDPGLPEAVTFLENKMKYHGKLGDGVRLDAFQYNMFPTNQKGETQWQYKNDENNQKKLPDAIMRGLKEAGVKPYLSLAEHLPPMTANYDVNKVNEYLEKNTPEFLGEKIPKLSLKKYPGIYTDVSYWDSYASGHDDPNIHNEKNGNPDDIRNEFIDLLGNRPARKFTIMFNDIFGCSDTYNYKDEAEGSENYQKSWKFRLPEDWESLYHRQLQNNLGFNAPEIYAGVLDHTKRAKDDDEAKHLKGVLKTFAAILKEKNENITTQEAANAAFGEKVIDDRLTNLF